MRVAADHRQEPGQPRRPLAARRRTADPRRGRCAVARAPRADGRTADRNEVGYRRFDRCALSPPPRPIALLPISLGTSGQAINPGGSGTMSEHQSAAKQALLAEAAAELKVDASIGDQLNYVRSYYRHVDPSDLVAAGPKRTGVVAAEHAELAAHRPQGRALVRVRSGAEASLLPSRDVIDVVTDDMPFLVDTITMTLASHDVTPEIVVHPQLMVRRDVTGALREVIRPIEGPRRIDKQRPLGTTGEPDQLAESWSHIEVARLDTEKSESIAAALERGLADVRMAVEDYPKMRAMAVRLADQFAAEGAAEAEEADAEGELDRPEGDGRWAGGEEGGTDAPESTAEIEQLLRWLL